MLFIWRGKGFMVPIVAIGSVALTTFAFMAMGLEDTMQSVTPLAALFSTVAIWKLHKFLDGRDSGLSIVDHETGESTPVVFKHDFYWIPLKYWPVLLGIWCVVSLVLEIKAAYFGGV